MPAWIPAAVEPAATPAVVKPIKDITADDARFVPSAIPLAISPLLAAANIAIVFFYKQFFVLKIKKNKS